MALALERPLSRMVALHYAVHCCTTFHSSVQVGCVAFRPRLRRHVPQIAAGSAIGPYNSYENGAAMRDKPISVWSGPLVLPKVLHHGHSLFFWRIGEVE